MKNKKVKEADLPAASRQCLLCGDVARGLNFNVLTCMSCKTFFRRHVYKKSSILSCQFENNCSITKNTRGYCSPCRLKKCLALGMDPQLIRIIPRSTSNGSKGKQVQTTDNRQIRLPRPLPLDLLQNDRSKLSSDEWTLLSNFLHSFDAYNPCSQIQHSLENLSSFPLKLRSKLSSISDIARQLFTSVGRIIECSSNFSSLPSFSRQILVKRNFHTTSTFNGILLCRDLHVLDNMDFLNGCSHYYGPDCMAICSRNIAQCDPNGNLMKIFIFVLAFSSSFSITSYHGQAEMSIMSDSKDLVRIQNIYVTMLWKYLIYLYGHKEAVLRFVSLVNTCLGVINMLNSMSSHQIRKDVMDKVVAETQLRLLIDD